MSVIKGISFLAGERLNSIQDFLLVGIGLTLFTWGTTKLITDSAPPLSRNAISVANVQELEGILDRKYDGTFSWDSVEVKNPIFLKDTLITDNSSTAQIAFKTGEVITIPPSTMIVVDLNEKDLSLELIKGSISVKVGKKAKKIFIKKKKKKYLIEGKDTSFKVINVKKSIKIKPITGIANLAATNIKQNESNIILGQSQKKVPPKIISPIDQEIIKPESGEFLIVKTANLIGGKLIIDQGKPIKISESSLYLPLPNSGIHTLNFYENDKEESLVDSISLIVSPYEAPVINLQKSKFSLFQGEKITIPIKSKTSLPLKVGISLMETGSKKETVIKDQSFSLTPKREGTYKIRAKVNRDKAKWSPWSQFTVETQKQLFIKSLGKKNILDLANGKKRTTLSVKDISKRSKTKLSYIIAKDPEFKNIVKSIRTRKKKITYSPKAPGKYFWKVEKVTNVNKKKITIESKHDIFEVFSQIATINKKTYQDNIITLKKNDFSHTFTWKRGKGIGSKAPFTFLLSENPDMSSPLIEESLSNSPKKDMLHKSTIKKTGKYFWQIRPTEENSYIKASDIYPITFTLPPKLPKPQIKAKQIITYKEIEGKDGYKIDLPKQKYAVYYNLEIYKDDKAKVKITKKRFKSNVGIWVSKRTGKYYYRLQIEDSWGRLGPNSDIGELYFPLSPFDDLGGIE